jgi:hypothetical protein
MTYGELLAYLQTLPESDLEKTAQALVVGDQALLRGIDAISLCVSKP